MISAAVTLITADKRTQQIRRTTGRPVWAGVCAKFLGLDIARRADVYRQQPAGSGSRYHASRYRRIPDVTS